jgi:hypothetical protein
LEKLFPDIQDIKMITNRDSKYKTAVWHNWKQPSSQPCHSGGHAGLPYRHDCIDYRRKWQWKGIIFKIIHSLSLRKHGKFIAINCGAIPEGTIDSELFGHEKGSFTGAHEARKGYFEVTDGGSIFLDEIGEMPLGTQARIIEGFGKRGIYQSRFIQSPENQCPGHCSYQCQPDQSRRKRGIQRRSLLQFEYSSHLCAAT